MICPYMREEREDVYVSLALEFSGERPEEPFHHSVGCEPL